MEFEIREVEGQTEVEEVVRLQQDIWDLPLKDTMSPITLTAMLSRQPRTGLLLGGFHKGRMVAFCVGFGTMEPGVILGHMLGVVEEFRDSGIGGDLLMRFFDVCRELGCKQVYNTYEPLEGRNAHLYLNKWNACGVGYKKAYYAQTGINSGIPLDRLIIIFGLNEMQNGPDKLEPLSQILTRYPVATTSKMPEADKVLVEIPSDLRSLQVEDSNLALTWRMETRKLFDEYINNRGMIVRNLYSQEIDGLRRNFYLLSRA